jgi:hypothetical protein
MMYWCSSCYSSYILDLLHVSNRVESSSGRELKEQIYFLDRDSGVCVCVCVCVCLVVERSHYFFTSLFTSLFFILSVDEVGGLLFLAINHFTVIRFTVLFHFVFL